MVFAVAAATAVAASGQSTAADDTDLQSWNDVSVTVPLTKEVDLYIPTSFRIGRSISRFNEGRLGAGISLKLTNRFSLTPAYIFIRYRDSSLRFRTEHRLNVKATYKFPVKHVGVSHTSQFEYRVKPSGTSWRYRPSITIDRKLPAAFGDGTRVFVTEDPFYDSATGRFSRNRLSSGISKPLSKKVTLKVYYLYQGDARAVPGSVHVIGTSWQIKL